MWDVLVESVEITLVVFVLMLLVELMELRLGHMLKKYLTANPGVQYVVSAVLGLIPGCNDAFIVVTLYISGIVSFGALVTVMVTTFGDEGFVLFSALADPSMGIHPSQIFILCAVLTGVGIGGGILADWLARKLPLRLAPKCVIPHHEEMDADRHFSWAHFLREHAFRHVFRKHIPALFLWMLGSLLVLHLLETHFHLSRSIQGSPAGMILVGALVGLLPFSGPNLIFITLLGKGMIPLSVLVTNSIVQDGHGLLPLLSFSLADGIKIKLFKLILGLAVGYGLFLAGL
jgi:hypothetical protein